MTTTESILLSTDETAKALRISKRTLFDLTKRGLPCIRLGARVLYEPTALREWLAQHKQQATN